MYLSSTAGLSPKCTVQGLTQQSPRTTLQQVSHAKGSCRHRCNERLQCRQPGAIPALLLGKKQGTRAQHFTFYSTEGETPTSLRVQFLLFIQDKSP